MPLDPALLCTLALLVSTGGTPGDRRLPRKLRVGEDTVVNEELFRRGYLAYRAEDVLFIHHSPCRMPGRLVRHHFIRGRGHGWILRDGSAEGPSFLPGLIARHLLPRTV